MNDRRAGGPGEIYEARLSERRRELERAVRRADRLGDLRLAMALGALVLVVLPLFTRHGGPWWFLLPLGLGFVLLGKTQERAFSARRRLGASVQFHEDGLARIEERWRNLADDGSDLVPPQEVVHYAGDLDLFGPDSLFQLVNRASTREGRRTLADWLCHRAGAEEIRARQTAWIELAPKLDLRESIVCAAAGEEPKRVDGASLAGWASASGALPAEALLRGLGLVHPALLAVTGLWFAAGGPAAPLLAAILLQLITLYATRRITAERAALLSGPDRALERYADLIGAIERAEVEARRLVELKARLLGSGVPASARISGLLRIVNLLDARLNVFFGLTVGPALMWDLNLVLRAERWKREVAPHLEAWFSAIGEFEALASFAALAFERPDYAAPDIVGEGPRFEVEALAHPLIDRRQVVANDLVLGGPGSVVLLSGSNMSGKSTLLRSVGINVVLAQAGGPVAARRLVMSEIELATSVRVVDSLAHGTSHFYAELKRLKLVVDASKRKAPAVLYLLDEMLHGTNSRERYTGARSIIRGLSRSDAMGIVTTHDLALADVAAELPPGKATNMHFSDEVEGGEIRFDYRLREGQVRSTNALRLMRGLGLEVEG